MLDGHSRCTAAGRRRTSLMRDHLGWRSTRRLRREAWLRRSPQAQAAQPWQEPTIPKTIGLPGEGTKSVPLYLDRALRAGFRELVVVEGPFDAGIAQVRGDRRVIAAVGATLSGAQIAALSRRQVGSVTLCFDPDVGGLRGTAS